MFDPRVAKLAQVLVQYSAGVKPGDLVSIRGTSLSEPLVQALLKETLKAGGVDDLVDIEKKTPNLAFYNAGAGSLVYIRGIGNNGYYVGGQESVAFYLDDVYTSRTTGFFNAYLDVDRIEVLLGRD